MIKVSFSFLVALLCCTAISYADVRLAPVFTEHMVLQRDKPLPIWGEAKPKALISVAFAGQTKTTRVDAQGHWKVVLPQQVASSIGRELVVSGDGSAKTLSDVLVGEVWVCAGQSNMEFPLKNEVTGPQALTDANNPLLRLNLWHYRSQYVYNAPFTPGQVEGLVTERFYEGGWAPATPESAREFSAIGYFFGRRLQQKLGVPVGIISLAAGGSPTEAWIRREALANNVELAPIVAGNWLENADLDDWCRLRGHQNLDKPLADKLAVPSDDLGPNHAFKPSFLWQAGIARLIPFAMRGVLWYQGESNSLELRRVLQHEKLFPLLVSDWRRQWGQSDFPFYFAQLSGIETTGYKSQFWPQFRDSQRRFGDTIHSAASVVTSDLGARNNVHPTNKHDVGERLASVALAKTYGQPIEWSGPSPRSLTLKGKQLVVSFNHAVGMRPKNGEAMRGFQIAGADGQFFDALARIEGTSVMLENVAVPHPLQVRYGWQPFTDANLENASGLPTSTFQLSLR
ncbi:sialate O-acetylesterase [bacterium]|nr:MAG: sialate O-acetylesterase [bacterium]